MVKSSFKENGIGNQVCFNGFGLAKGHESDKCQRIRFGAGYA